jgi:periplasmic divalent cation tolerance protein
MRKQNFGMILSLVPNRKAARSLANGLLKEKMAACVSIIPGLESHYVWKGKKEQTKELLLLIKTRASLYKKVETFILKNHPYECPPVILVSSKSGVFTKYLNWVIEETSNA